MFIKTIKSYRIATTTVTIVHKFTTTYMHIASLLETFLWYAQLNINKKDRWDSGKPRPPA